MGKPHSFRRVGFFVGLNKKILLLIIDQQKNQIVEY
jgi:hypothetical protein